MGKGKRVSVYKAKAARKRKLATAIIPEITFYEKEAPNGSEEWSEPVTVDVDATAAEENPSNMPINNDSSSEHAPSTKITPLTWTRGASNETVAQSSSDDVSYTAVARLNETHPTDTSKQHSDDALHGDTARDNASHDDDDNIRPDDAEVDQEDTSSEDAELKTETASHDSQSADTSQCNTPKGVSSPVDTLQSDEEVESTPELSPEQTHQEATQPNGWSVQSSTAAQSNDAALDNSQPEIPEGDWHPARHSQLPPFDPPAFLVSKTGDIKARGSARVKKIPGVKANFSLTIPFCDFERILDLDEIIVSTFSETVYDSKTEYLIHKDGNPFNHRLDNLGRFDSLDKLQQAEIELQQERHPGTKYVVAKSNSWGVDYSNYLVSDSRKVYSLMDRKHLASYKNKNDHTLVDLMVRDVDGILKRHPIDVKTLVTKSFDEILPVDQNVIKNDIDQLQSQESNKDAIPMRIYQSGDATSQLANHDLCGSNSDEQISKNHRDIHDASQMQPPVMDSHTDQPNVIKVPPPIMDNKEKNRAPPLWNNALHSNYPDKDIMFGTQPNYGPKQHLSNGDPMLNDELNMTMQPTMIPNLHPNQYPYHGQEPAALDIQSYPKHQFYNGLPSMLTQNMQQHMFAESPAYGQNSPYTSLPHNHEALYPRSQPPLWKQQNLDVPYSNDHDDYVENDVYDPERNVITHHMPRSKVMFEWDDQYLIPLQDSPSNTPSVCSRSIQEDQSVSDHEEQDLQVYGMHHEEVPNPQRRRGSQSTQASQADAPVSSPQNTDGMTIHNTNISMLVSNKQEDPMHTVIDLIQQLSEAIRNIQNPHDTRFNQLKNSLEALGKIPLGTESSQSMHTDQQTFSSQQSTVKSEIQDTMAQRPHEECDAAEKKPQHVTKSNDNVDQIASTSSDEVDQLLVGRKPCDTQNDESTSSKMQELASNMEELQADSLEKRDKATQTDQDRQEASAKSNGTVDTAEVQPSPSDEELWRPVGTLPWNDKSFSQYEVSNLGRIRKSDTHNVLEETFTGTGDAIVRMTYDKECSPSGKRTVTVQVAVSRIVAKAFVEGYSETQNIVKHRNEDPKDNTARNLKWVGTTHTVTRSRGIIVRLLDGSGAEKRFSSVRQAEIELSVPIKLLSSEALEKTVRWDGEYQKALIKRPEE